MTDMHVWARLGDLAGTTWLCIRCGQNVRAGTRPPVESCPGKLPRDREADREAEEKEAE
jgi:hypothetical protein